MIDHNARKHGFVCRPSEAEITAMWRAARAGTCRVPDCLVCSPETGDLLERAQVLTVAWPEPRLHTPRLYDSFHATYTYRGVPVWVGPVPDAVVVVGIAHSPDGGHPRCGWPPDVVQALALLDALRTLALGNRIDAST